ncbi:MAG: hypothetical protein AB7T49_20015 [Oligoflexales bacterium]
MKRIQKATLNSNWPVNQQREELEMTQSNQIKKSDDFKLMIVLRVDGRNSRAIFLRFMGIAATLIAIGSKIVFMFMERGP